MEDYWRMEPCHKGPVHELSDHMGNTRFFQFRRNLTLMDGGNPPYDIAALWFQLIESLVYHLREAFMICILSGTSISIRLGNDT